MNKNVLIVLGGAILVAFLVAFLVQISIGGKKETVKVVEKPQIEILIAAKNLPVGHELKEGDMVWQSWPADGIFPGAVRRGPGGKAPHEAVSGMLSRPVAEGEPILSSALLKEGASMVSAQLEKGMRAVAINVSASAMVAGFIGPGDYVDIILTYRETIKTTDEDPRVKALVEMNLDKMATETIMEKVKVLAVDQMATRPEENPVKVGRTVTVAVSVQDAERLSLATKLGDLTLALRGIGDDSVIEKTWPTISDLRLTKIGDEIYKETMKLKQDSGLNENIMRIYNGSSVSVTTTR